MSVGCEVGAVITFCNSVTVFVEKRALKLRNLAQVKVYVASVIYFASYESV